MPERWRSPGPDAIRKAGGFSQQLEIPLFRDVSPRTGLIPRNTEFGDRVRRFLQRHLPSGAAAQIAGGISARTSRVYDELEGRVTLSFDVAWSGLCLIGCAQRHRAFAALLKPFDYVPLFIGHVRDFDESAA